MITIFLKNTLSRIRLKLPIYNFTSSANIQDEKRDRFDLINDIRRKRFVLSVLKRKLANQFYIILLLLILLSGTMFTYYSLNFERRIFKNYLHSFTDKIYTEKNTSNLIEDTELIIAFSYIKEGKYDNAAMVLANSETEDSQWLRALCYIRLKNVMAAKASLNRIAFNKGVYSTSAKNILKKYYKD